MNPDSMINRKVAIESVELDCSHEFASKSQESQSSWRRDVTEVLTYFQSLSAFSCDHGVPVEQLSVSLSEVRERGVRDSELRMLIVEGWIHHLRETTDSASPLRTFLSAGRSLNLHASSCFLHGKAILDLSCSSTDSSTGPSAMPCDSRPSNKPSWNHASRRLVFEGIVVKQFRVPASSQEKILDAFEEEGWPRAIDDPLPPIASIDSKQRLRDTVRCLNRNRINQCIHFCTVDNGEAIQWSPTSSPIDISSWAPPKLP